MSELTALEKMVLGEIVRIDPDGAALSEQIHVAEVISREFSGVGFFTELRVPENVRKVDAKRWKFEAMGHAHGEHPSLPGGAHFILWIKNGVISTLEGCTNEGNWPGNEDAFRVSGFKIKPWWKFPWW